MSYLFAYGSLRAAADHAGIRDLVAELKPIGTGRLPGRMYYLGNYPGAVFDDSATGSVVGEVLEFDGEMLLAKIDAYEAFDPARPNVGEYVRRKLVVEVAGLGSIDCWLYELRRVPDGAVPIDGGDYIAWLCERRRV